MELTEDIKKALSKLSKKTLAALVQQTKCGAPSEDKQKMIDSCCNAIPEKGIELGIKKMRRIGQIEKAIIFENKDWHSFIENANNEKLRKICDAYTLDQDEDNNVMKNSIHYEVILRGAQAFFNSVGNPLLKDICKEFKKPLGGNKRDLTDRIMVVMFDLTEL